MDFVIIGEQRQGKVHRPRGARHVESHVHPRLSVSVCASFVTETTQEVHLGSGLVS